MSCMEKYIKSANFADTGFSYTMSLISGKHKMVILYCLMEYEPVRFNEMKRYLGTITDKTLSSNLKELEAVVSSCERSIRRFRRRWSIRCRSAESR